MNAAVAKPVDAIVSIASKWMDLSLFDAFETNASTSYGGRATASNSKAILTFACMLTTGLILNAAVVPTPPVTPGEPSAPYRDAQSATNAAAKINADKSGSIVVPDGVEGEAKATYLSKVEATVTSDNCVVIDLTSAAKEEEQTAVDAAVTNAAVVAALVSTNQSATATIENTTPGLYYWIAGGTEVSDVSEPGTPTLSTDGGSVELAKPSLDVTNGRAFFKVAAGVASPAQ